MSTATTPLWEVFVRPRRGLSHIHVGSVHAPDAEMALRNARDVYTRRQEGVSIWVVPAGAITASSPDEKDAFFDPAADKVYRHPTFYDVPDGVKHLWSSSVSEYCLRLGDDALIAAQRLAEWSAAAPEMEEDIALSNIALDQLGVARLLLSYAGEADGRSEDDLAYLRGDAEFRNCLLVELPNAGPNAAPGRAGDFGVTMVKLLFLSAYQWLLYADLAQSRDERIAGVAAKAVKESSYHLDHSSQWTIRLGDGTEESHLLMQQAVDELWPYTHELFATDPLLEELEAVGIARQPRREQWTSVVNAVLAKATLDVPADGWAPTGGRLGRHTEHLSYLLAEMQVLHRAHPGANW